jgi:hypothetical protein
MASPEAAEPLDRAAIAAWARAKLAKRWLSEFVQQAIAAGEVHGCTKVDWGPHLDAVCLHTQLQLEGWLVAYGLGTPEMIQRQRECWERTGATWEDDAPEPWLRYVLVQNQLYNLPPGTLKSTIVMVLAVAWMWLHAPGFIFGCSSGIDANVTRDSNATRDIIRSAWYRDTFGIAWETYDVEDPDPEVRADITIRSDVDSVSHWATSAGGIRYSRTWQRGFTGMHCDCVTGDTLVATEDGEIAIEDLVLMSPMPRVWSMNHETNEIELSTVSAWRRIDGRQTVDVVVNDCNVLRCTDDHRIFTDRGYIKAGDSVGRSVSVLRWPEQAGQHREAAKMFGVRNRDPDLRDVLEIVSARRCGAGQESAKDGEIRTVLLEEMSESESRWPSIDADLSMRADLQAPWPQANEAPLLGGVRCLVYQETVSGSSVRLVCCADEGRIDPRQVLLQEVQEQGALHRDDGGRKLELQGAPEAILRRSVDTHPAADQGARRERMRGVPFRTSASGATSASHRREPSQQHARESHHVVPHVPHRVPQVEHRTVLSSAASFGEDGQKTYTVYDLQVAGNHNFFASGILVHNCLLGDDPDDADRVHAEPARIATQNKWTNAMETRVNDEHRSVRLVMQQVVHAEGMSAYLLSLARWSARNPKGWSHLCIAAEYGFGPADVPEVTPYGWSDWRTQKGDTMHPRLSPGVLADKRLKLPGYEGQFNQNASRITNGMFARRHARFFVYEHENVAVLRRRPDGCPSRVDQPPVVIRLGDLDRITLSVDAANSLDPKPGAKVSAVGLIVGGCRGEERYVLDDRTRILGVGGTYRAIYELVAAWALERILVELKALGAGVVEELQRSIKRGWYLDEQDRKVELLGPDGQRPRCVVEPFQPGKEDKIQRANAMLPTWDQGLFFLHDGARWLYPHVDAETRKTLDEGYIGEKCSFPGSRRKDRVDAESQWIAKYRGSQDTREEWRAMRRLAVVGARGR